jgi:hypothetical protein
MENKLNSKQLMDVMKKSQDAISTLETDINLTKSELAKRLNVIKNVQDYTLKQTTELNLAIADGLRKDTVDKVVLAKADIKSGVYNIFGSTMHPAFVRTPTDIFNLSTVAGPVFKNNATVKVNGSVNDAFKNMLMSDAITGKSIAFDVFDRQDIMLEITVNPEDLLGSTDFNIIEILPYIPGSFTIKQIEVYTMQSYATNSAVADLIIKKDITNFGASRIMIDTTRTLYRIIFTIRLDYQNDDGKYPFGIKHMYFLKGNYDTKSNVIVKLNHDKYIGSIGEDIIVTDQNGTYSSTCKEEGIKLYMSYDNGVLGYEITTSHGLAENTLARNIKEFYASIPIDRSMISIKFDDITDK